MRSIFFLAFLCCVIPAVKAQQLDDALNRYANEYTSERCYLHYDKSSYGPGETIWFKAYVLKGILPATDSKNFYVDISDEKGKLLAHNVLPMVEGGASGNFDIPTGYKGEYLHVKAYTKWMLNFDTAFLYNRDIKILVGRPANAKPLPAVIPTLQFFPEGGDAVTGISGKIAFKANDQWGKPVKVTGTVVNNAGAKVADITTQHDGMGSFALTPKTGEKYTAKWKDEKGKDYTTALPAAKAGGVNLAVISGPDKRTINVTANAADAEALQKVVIIGTMHQFKVFEVVKDISSGSTTAIVPTSSLITGILNVTVFNQAMQPLAERISFVNNDDYTFKPEFTVDHWGLSKRARNKVDIFVPDSLIANMSISITDVNIDSDSSSNIYSHLLLSSEIKGMVYKPSYYFTANTEAVQQHLDLVMLTNGWRRFNWEMVTKNQFPKINYPMDSMYLTLSGQVIGLTPSQVREAGSITLLLPNPNKAPDIINLPLLSTGMFIDSSLLLFDTLKVSYQVGSKNKFGDPLVRFMPNFLPPLEKTMVANGKYNDKFGDTTGLGHHWFLAGEAASLLRQYEGALLDEVVVKAKTKTRLQEMDEKYTSGMFTGDGVQFDLTNETGALGSMDIFQFLQGRVAGLQISGTGQNVQLTWRGATPQLYINEMQSQVDMVANTPVSDIAYIKIFRPPFFGGFGGGSGGAIAIYTRRGDDVKREPGKGLASGVVKGYQAIKQFYSPNYDTFTEENKKKDLRTTLYWNPQVITNGRSNKLSFTFYNNDITESFRVIIEGITRDGRMTRIEQIME